MVSYEEIFRHQEQLSLAHTNDRLQNQLREKERHLETAQGEIKALRASEVIKDRAIEELRNEVEKLDEKLFISENIIDQKNLEIKKLTNLKKDALAAQFAAEAALRRVYAEQKDDDPFSLEFVIAPLEAEIKMYKNEIAALQEDIKAFERHTKSKEIALLEAQKILKSALERALIVEEVQNCNFELRRQIEICLEENKILEKTNRQKVLEVEKLSQTIQGLEEAILAGGSAANAVRDYRRQISELREENRTLERELARVKVSANRIATVVANDWKGDSDKVMPIKQWLEERRLMQAEIQRLKDKLAISERTSKVEAHLKDKLKLRLTTLEEGLKHAQSLSINPSPVHGSFKTAKSNSKILEFLTGNGTLRKMITSQTSYPVEKQTMEHEARIGTGEVSKQVSCFKRRDTSQETIVRKGIWTSRSKVVDSDEKEKTANTVITASKIQAVFLAKNDCRDGDYEETSQDMVSGFLYDRVQKEVINLRKACAVRDDTLSVKDEEIKMLMRKVEALTKATEVESKRMKRETAARIKETGSVKVNQSKKAKDTTPSKSRIVKNS